MVTTRVARDSLGIDIAVYGLRELERALKAFSPDVAKEMNGSIRSALNVTRDRARARIPNQSPMSGWSSTGSGRGRSRGGAGWPGFDPSRARAGITVRKGNARNARGRSTLAVAWRLESRDPAATIFDKSAVGHSSVGRQFVDNLNTGFGKSQRVLWPAWLQTRTLALAEVEAAINRAQQRLQQAADRIDGRGAA
jgi:hypothetical protein